MLLLRPDYLPTFESVVADKPPRRLKWTPTMDDALILAAKNTSGSFGKKNREKIVGDMKTAGFDVTERQVYYRLKEPSVNDRLHLS